MSKGILSDYLSYRKIKNTVLKNSENKLKILVDTWVERLNGKPFHGGESPDAADFRVLFIIFKVKRYLINERKILILFNEFLNYSFMLC